MSSPSDPSGRRYPLGALLALVVVSWLLAACTGEEAIPIDPANPPTTVPDLTGVTHAIEPTEQMRAEAERQCADDPDLVDGYVRAVDPDTDQVLSELTVDCAEVRGDG
ncbi:MAG: hypothetical protein AAGA93_10215 [Actinomycetota bacterium]